MTTRTVYEPQSVAGLMSLVFAALGLLFFWLVPLGSMVAAVGVVSALVGIVQSYARGGRALRQSVAGLLLSGAALTLSLWIPLMLRGALPEIF
jgi:hypothetical protein